MKNTILPISKTILSFISLLFFVGNIFSQSYVNDLSPIVKKVENSVFIIYTFNENKEPIAQGSGFFISNTGICITNFHVLQGCSSAIIKTKNGNEFPVTTIIDFDSKTDLVKFKITEVSGKVTPSLSITNTIPKRGESIFNIGNPLGLEQTVSSGILSSIREIPPYGDLIQITAPISEGSSGSPIFNSKGEVIGVATMGFKKGQNLNFAVPTRQINNLNKSQNKRLTDLNKNPLATVNYEKAIEEYIIDNLQVALEYLEKELNTNSKNHLALNLKGRILVDLEDYNGAIESLLAAIRLNSSSKDYLNNLGLAMAKYGYTLNGNFDIYSAAQMSYKNAINLDPNYDVAYYNYAYLIYNNIFSSEITSPVIEKKYIYDALELLNKAIELNPEYAKAFSLRARIKFELKDNWNALADIEKAISIDDQNYEFYFFRGELKSFGLMDYSTAVIDFTKALELATKNKQKADILGLRSITNKLLGKINDACSDATLAYRFENDELYRDLIKETCK